MDVRIFRIPMKEGGSLETDTGRPSCLPAKHIVSSDSSSHVITADQLALAAELLCTPCGEIEYSDVFAFVLSCDGTGDYYDRGKP